MLTYDLTKTDGPLYKCLYECIKNDISQGKLSSGEKMPSKRTLAKNLGVSTITVENAYDQLIGEGYMFARPKRGYFIADVSDIRVIKAPVHKELSIKSQQNYVRFVGLCIIFFFILRPTKFQAGIFFSVLLIG